MRAREWVGHIIKERERGFKRTSHAQEKPPSRQGDAANSSACLGSIYTLSIKKVFFYRDELHDKGPIKGGINSKK